MTISIERVYEKDIKNNQCSNIKLKFINTCVQNETKFNRSKCKVIFNLLQKCQKNNKVITFSGP